MKHTSIHETITGTHGSVKRMSAHELKYLTLNACLTHWLHGRPSVLTTNKRYFAIHLQNTIAIGFAIWKQFHLQLVKERTKYEVRSETSWKTFCLVILLR